MKIISRADELVLLTVWRLQEDAYGVPIRKHIIKMTNTDWSVGAIYDSLERLTLWGYVEYFQSDPTPERGGRSKRFYKLTKTGMEALKNLKKVQQTMWENLPEMKFETGR